MSKAKQPQLRLRIMVPGRGAIGPGKIDLLKAIDSNCSIAAAARTLGMSYRRAWMLVEETKTVLGADVLTTRAGGADRGGAVLTEKGRALVKAYAAICDKAEGAARTEIEALWPRK